jgi:hypothetical protein
VLNDYRDQLISERVRLVSRLRWQLVQIAPELEAQIRPAGLIGPRIRANLARKLTRLPHSPQLRVARAMLKRICEIYREEAGLLAELGTLIQAHSPQLLEERGCGPVAVPRQEKQTRWTGCCRRSRTSGELARRCSDTARQPASHGGPRPTPAPGCNR